MLISTSSYSQLKVTSQVIEKVYPVSVGGSFAMAVPCKNGILIAADSRSVISDKNGKKLAYYNGVQKVFPIGNMAIAYTGLETIKNIHFGAIIDAFAETLTNEVSLDQLLPTFLNFTDSRYFQQRRNS